MHCIPFLKNHHAQPLLEGPEDPAAKQTKKQNKACLPCYTKLLKSLHHENHLESSFAKLDTRNITGDMQISSEFTVSTLRI